MQENKEKRKLKEEKKRLLWLLQLSRTQRTNGCACTPHLAVTHLFEFVSEFLAVISGFAAFQNYACFFA
jgi:hypothetical protein